MESCYNGSADSSPSIQITSWEVKIAAKDKLIVHIQLNIVYQVSAKQYTLTSYLKVEKNQNEEIWLEKMDLNKNTQK